MGPADATGDEGRTQGGPPDDDNSWMERIGELEEAQVDDLIAGVAPPGVDDLEVVAAFVARLRSVGQASAPPPMSAALRAQLAPRQPSRSRRRALVGVAVAGSLAMGSVGLAAAEGVLPDPAQRAVARVAEIVGWDLPDPDESPAPSPATGGDKSGETPPTDPGSAGTDASSGADGSGPPTSTPPGVTPATPATPGGPDQPATPATPATPADPGGPGQPATPADPGGPGQPATPATAFPQGGASTGGNRP